MAFSNITEQALGKFLTIAFAQGIKSQIVTDAPEWEMILQSKVDNPDGRQTNFYFQNSLGPAAVQWRNPGSVQSFPTSQKTSNSEHTAVYKELYATIEIEGNLWKRALNSKSKYDLDPLIIEMEAKSAASRRQMAMSFYGDGTGVVAEVASADDTNIGTGSIVVTVEGGSSAAGFIGFCEYGDLLLGKQTAGTARSPSGGSSFYAYLVSEVDRENNQVTLTLVNSDGSTNTSYTASNLADGDFLYRVGQPTFPNRASISDYGTATEVLAGLESLAAADGRAIHGITMSGSAAGSHKDGGGAPLDVSMIQAVLDKAKLRSGQGSVRYKKLVCAPEANAALIEARETDRRFNSVTDNARGTTKFVYQHNNDALETETSEFCPKQRIYGLPESSNGKKIIEYRGTDFDAVKTKDGNAFFMKPSSSGGYENVMTAFVNAMGVLIVNRPSAIAVVKNFAL